MPETASDALDVLLARRKSEHARHYPIHQMWLEADDPRGDPFVSSCACCCSVCEALDEDASAEGGAA